MFYDLTKFLIVLLLFFSLIYPSHSDTIHDFEVYENKRKILNELFEWASEKEIITLKQKESLQSELEKRIKESELWKEPDDNLKMFIYNLIFNLTIPNMLIGLFLIILFILTYFFIIFNERKFMII